MKNKNKLVFMQIRCFLSIILSVSLLGSCSDDPDQYGHIRFNFTHFIDGDPVRWKTMEYTNAAGNEFEVTEAQWFISDVFILDSRGNAYRVFESSNFCYVDSNLPLSLSRVSSTLPEQSYSAIRFTFGLKGENNIPGQFPDPPESNMMWPYALGGDYGGYHYMKLNGFWRDASGLRTPFNFHLGVGQIYNDDGNVVEFVQNWFEVTLPVSVEVRQGHIAVLEMRMNIDKWFDGSFVYDHDHFGGMIMKNQEALAIIRENGKSVFSIHNHSTF